MSLLFSLPSYCGADGVDDWPPARWGPGADGRMDGWTAQALTLAQGRSLIRRGQFRTG